MHSSAALKKIPRFFQLLIIIIVVFAVLVISPQVQAQDWLPVRGGILYGISGMALVEQQDNSLGFLIVHDNKKKDEARLAIISIKDKQQPKYSPVKWQDNTELPIDLESITSVPGKKSFIALASAGKAYEIKLDAAKNNISVIQKFDLPKIPQGSNFEGFSLQNIDNKLVTVWAHRGEAKQPAIIYWGVLDLAKSQITQVDSANLSVPFPSGNVRHISDLKVDPTGIIFISAASDDGNDGPFQSAVYVIGSVGFRGNKLGLQQNTQLVPLYRSHSHKIEGLELVPGANGGVIVGTDDENLGSYVYIMGE
ncbi:hypothetical protein [Calothrix sp. PCC 7507]|uniref:hypothetical protein n=1 Tax=Calothrix sp. PCC 7507 TaxID=99598 RepID=UPI00029F05EE|nr:hypothetical protein [Calothrix sp. PCC 7507]AFY35072.1 hypothetical protein Cal7507_4712 [Calothrix sp. PCC 7507]